MLHELPCWMVKHTEGPASTSYGMDAGPYLLSVNRICPVFTRSP